MEPHFQKHGKAPFTIVVVHGGPGALGDVSTLVEELAINHGVVEPLLSKQTVVGQLDELKSVIEAHATTPIVLIGHSYGALLSFLFCARNPKLVQKLILISSGAFTVDYAEQTSRTRLARLSESQKQEFDSVGNQLHVAKTFTEKKQAMTEYGRLLQQADSFKLMPHVDESDALPDVYENVWPEMVALRKSGELLKARQNIKCRVFAMQGDYDPRPADGVQKPLQDVLADFTFTLIPDCGHYPWFEQEAKQVFFEDLQTFIEIH
jgi:pimeloyl-ACP methyl ester carboxylesterase